MYALSVTNRSPSPLAEAWRHHATRWTGMMVAPWHRTLHTRIRFRRQPGIGTQVGTDAFYKFTPETKSHPHIPPLSPPDMPCFDFQPAKQVECGDQRLKRAQALFDEHGAVMDTHDRELAQSLLDYSSDLRKDFEAKCLLTRIEQARLYCAQVDKTLQKIQAVVFKVKAADFNSVDDSEG